MKVLILGAGGMLGAELHRQTLARGDSVQAFDRELDITDSVQIDSKVAEFKPDIIFNCAAYNAVDKAEDEPEQAQKLNADSVGIVANAAKKNAAILVHFSTGFIFDGTNPSGYAEQSQPNPQSVYAQTKYRGEQALSGSGCDFYLVRLNLLFGAAGQSAGSKKSFPALILDLAKTKDSFDFVNDEISTPTYAPDLAKATLQLVYQKYPFGIYHLVNSGQASWYDWAKLIFAEKQIAAKINAVSASAFPRKARRPACSVLLNTKFPALRSWQEATKEFLQTL